MPRLLVSDPEGNISSDPRLQATAMEGGRIFRVRRSDLIKLPGGSKIFMLPSRSAVGYDRISGSLISMKGMFSVAAFLSPGYTAAYSAAYIPAGRPKQLPLFSYAAACMYGDSIYATALHIDRDRRHDCRYIDLSEVRKNIDKITRLLPGNRLVAHLKNCALIHGCPNAQNFFLARYEAPLPVSPSCNASCLGCISFQPDKKCPASQPRITFVPTAEEVSQIALLHIGNVKRPIVSFGQGCEGEPLLQNKLIGRSIALIRKVTSKGTINLNTNGSKPVHLARLIDAGLNSVRISMNSVREPYYRKYYKPRGYSFKDVLNSVKTAKKRGAFVSVNYLTMPGFTDARDEFKAFRRFISEYKIDMVQWRNLNYDPLRYFEELNAWPAASELLGVKYIINSLKKEFPRLRMGYFNPSL